MKQYHDFLSHILKHGIEKKDRTGTGTISAVVPPQMRFNLSEGFPIVTTKEIDFDLIKYELKWFTLGDTNVKYLLNNGVNIWNGDAYRWYKERGGSFPKKVFLEKLKNDEGYAAREGDLGPIYGAQWRNLDIGDEWPHSVDQLSDVIEKIEEVKNGNAKYARRLIVNAWNAGAIHKMALPPCHVMFQFFVVDGKLSCHLTQRSGDAFLGIPFNISSYSLLTHIIANQVGLEVGEFIHTVGDAHIYLNHIEQVKEQLSREPYELPKLIHPEKVHIDSWDPKDFTLEGYKHHPKIKGALSV